MVYRVGITGGLASGKTTVAKRLEARGIPLLDADEVVHDLYKPGAPGTTAVASLFGKQMLDATGAVDRKRLAARVFSDPVSLKNLNRAVHPLVIMAQAKWFDSLAAAGKAIGAIEATLLVESGGRVRYDFLVAVSAPEAVRLQRALKRAQGEDAGALMKRMAAQIADSEREAVADLVIVNDGTEEQLLKKADVLADLVLAKSAERKKRA